MTQEAVMRYDPATGETRPYPSHAEQWRIYHAFTRAWLFDPWLGTRRSADDVGRDMFGRAVRTLVEPLTMPAQAQAEPPIGKMQAQPVKRRRAARR